VAPLFSHREFQSFQIFQFWALLAARSALALPLIPLWHLTLFTFISYKTSYQPNISKNAHPQTNSCTFNTAP
jgi:hypothetical protein